MKARMRDSYLLKCFIIVFLYFIIDSTIAFFLPYNFTKTGITIVPCLGLMIFAMLVRTIDGAERYFFATVCGLYYSIVYSNTLAIYILIYCLIAFVRSYLFKLESLNLFESMIFCVLTVFAQEVVLYWLMWITNMTRYSISSFMLMRILPTLMANLILSIPIYWIYKKVKIEVE
ncbi:MAG: rod shape-determining protein MreD [Longibaculum sp.]